MHRFPRRFRNVGRVRRRVKEVTKGGEKTEDNSYKLVSQDTRKKTVSTTKPTTTKKKSSATVKRTTPSKTKATPAKKKSNTTVKRKPTPPKAKAATAKRVTKKPEQKKKKTKTQLGVLDLLQLLQGNYKSGKKGRIQDGCAAGYNGNPLLGQRCTVSTVFTPGNFQGFALVNRQRTNRISSGFTVEVSTEGTQLSYTSFDYLGKLKFTVSYVAGARGTLIDDGDVQIIGNDITLVARQPWPRRAGGSRETQGFEITFTEDNWRRPDGMPATREHLLMVLADLDDILIRATFSSEMISSSLSELSMDVSVPNYSGLEQSLGVEQCLCPPGYLGLSCQDCAPGYTRTGGGLYLGHCEPCECNGHSDSCHPETGICTGELCEQCAPGFFGDPTAGTPEDCQSCACPHTDPDNQFSPTCESLGNGGYQCTACQPGYTGQYCERSCLSGGEGVSREGLLLSGGVGHSALPGAELFFPSVQQSDGGVYVCTCRDNRSTNRSRAEIVVTSVPSKAIESPAYTLVWTRKGNGKLPTRAMDFNGILTVQNVQRRTPASTSARVQHVRHGRGHRRPLRARFVIHGTTLPISPCSGSSPPTPPPRLQWCMPCFLFPAL
ncbi:hypothetical protein F7725_001427 [Dissostichus mawsoni]|uniref:Basement membrane-specific heparan sulfate proteoglycan core protein-like n=1 Tax=Dissostichus mawsoni TaxID=36200 RepID=A0A7J5ZH81_DISMA|nr:hypothetical protein F7725_001427 [Dissostichus mawsoni]